MQSDSSEGDLAAISRLEAIEGISLVHIATNVFVIDFALIYNCFMLGDLPTTYLNLNFNYICILSYVASATSQSQVSLQTADE